MPAQPDDHWGKLASEFGVKATSHQPDADAESGVASEAVKLQPPAQPKPVSPVPSRLPEKPKVEAPPKKNVPRPVAHWDSLAGELGLEVPPREVEAELEVEPQDVSSSAPTPVFASRSPIAELFVPRETGDEDMLEIIASVRVERSDASYFDITESAAGDVEDSIEVIVEDLEEEVGTQPRRRRRRSRSRRSSQLTEPVSESQQEPRAELEIESEPAEEILESLVLETAEPAEFAPVDPDAEEPDGRKPAEGERSRSRRRPRRRRRSKGSEPAERGKEESRAVELPAAVPADRRVDDEDLDVEELEVEDLEVDDLEVDDLEVDDLEVDDLEVDDLDGDDLEDQGESTSGNRKSKSKKITGWIEAVSVMVDANIERHKKGDTDRNRGGRSRGRRGR